MKHLQIPVNSLQSVSIMENVLRLNGVNLFGGSQFQAEFYHGTVFTMCILCIVHALCFAQVGS